MAVRFEINSEWDLIMTELNFEEIYTVFGGAGQGLGGTGTGSKNDEHESVTAFREWKMRNLTYGLEF
jgi:hypothetical protein